MIGRLSGRLLEKLPPHLLLDVQGVGYEVDAPMTTFYQLPAVGEAVTLHIHQVVREDALLLYGFASRAERETFRQLLKVSGIGSAAGLSLAATPSLPRSSRISRSAVFLPMPGTLDRRATFSPATASADITHALLALGYNDKEASAAVKTLPAGAKLEDGIRLALKALVKA